MCSVHFYQYIKDMAKTDLIALATTLPNAWNSKIVGQAAGSNFKVLRMGGTEYPNEVHDFDEALLVLEGQMNLVLEDKIIQVAKGEVYIVPAGVPHAVAPGSHGVLVIVDRDA